MSKMHYNKVEQMVQGHERNYESGNRKTDVWDTATEVHWEEKAW